MTMQLVETITVGSGGAASIEFTNIPQDATDLFLVVSGRVSGFFPGTLVAQGNALFNGTELTTGRFLQGNGSSVSSTTYGGGEIAYPTNNTTSNTFGNASLYICNYTSTTNKSVSFDTVTENNATSANQRIAAGVLALLTGVTTIQCSGGGGTLEQGSTFSLYKITKA